ncbi:hypothetical protein VTN00DRAFT_3998 [Thermoascus crustaceus]|uniref:uncharacterized protein n=1 Tax=Thermoascus crustaceus TaxID=5088 RepID=UPI003743E794
MSVHCSAMRHKYVIKPRATAATPPAGLSQLENVCTWKTVRWACSCVVPRGRGWLGTELSPRVPARKKQKEEQEKVRGQTENRSRKTTRLSFGQAFPLGHSVPIVVPPWTRLRRHGQASSRREPQDGLVMIDTETA